MLAILSSIEDKKLINKFKINQVKVMKIGKRKGITMYLIFLYKHTYIDNILIIEVQDLKLKMIQLF